MSLQAIIRHAAPAAQPLDGIALDPAILDGPDPGDIIEDVREAFCLACQAPVARFESLGGELAHYDGDPLTDDIMPCEADHAPLLP